MKLKIVSDGTSKGSHLLTEDGQEIEMVQAVTWTLDCRISKLATVTVTLLKVPVELEGYLEKVIPANPSSPPPPEPEDTNPAKGIGIVL